jgi:hypothetical protein
MDTTVNPPVRLQALSSSSIPKNTALARLDDFLDDFESRGTPSKAADTTVTAQLQKLSLVLHQECARKDRLIDAAWWVSE